MTLVGFDLLPTGGDVVSSPVAQKAAMKGPGVLGKSKDAARSKEKEEGECLHSESGEVRLVGELVQKGAGLL